MASGKDFIAVLHDGKDISNADRNRKKERERRLYCRGRTLQDSRRSCIGTRITDNKKALEREITLIPKPIFTAIFSYAVTGCGQICGQKSAPK